jgi:hypothetical protein
VVNFSFSLAGSAERK